MLIETTVQLNLTSEGPLPFLRLFLGISWAVAETKHCSTLVGSSESYSPCTWNGRTHLELRFGYLVCGSRVYEVVSLWRFSGVVWPSSLYTDSLSARTSSGVACPLAQLFTAQQASKELKNPLAQPDPVGQKGWNKMLKHQSTHTKTLSELHLCIYYWGELWIELCWLIPHFLQSAGLTAVNAQFPIHMAPTVTTLTNKFFYSVYQQMHKCKLLLLFY
jgi:hypothetical protein